MSDGSELVDAESDEALVTAVIDIDAAVAATAVAKTKAAIAIAVDR